MDIKEMIKKDIYEALKEYITIDDIIVEYPKDRKMADYAVPCFSYAKVMRKSPNDIALMIKDSIKNQILKKKQ